MKTIKFLSIIAVLLCFTQVSFGQQDASKLDKGRDAGTQPGTIVQEDAPTQARVQNPYSPSFSDADIPGAYGNNNHSVKEVVVDNFYPSDLDAVYDELNTGSISQEVADRINQLEAQMQDLIQYNDLLRKENQAIKNSLNACCSSSNGELDLANAYILQNAPNPFTKSSVINYFVPNAAQHVEINISTIQGEVIQSYPVSETGFGNIELDAKSLATGTYVYSLHVNGEFVDSKLMIITK